jgi:hypothetical protein
MLRQFIAVLSLVACTCQGTSGDILHESLFAHPLVKKLNSELQLCAQDQNYCDENFSNLTALSAKVANDYAFLLLHDVVQSIFIDSFFTISPESRLGQRISHIRASLAFSVGDFVEARRQWKYMNNSDLITLRSWAAQEIVTGNEQKGLQSLERYRDLMAERLEKVVSINFLDDLIVLNASNASAVRNASAISGGSGSNAAGVSDKESEELLVSILLGEAFGGIRINPKLGDVSLPPGTFTPLEASVHFRLGVGLAKLGMFDLAVKHVSLSATPWEAPLYRLRSQLSFPPTHSSLRSLAQAVDMFESQCETILLYKSHKALLMSAVCNSLDDAALALQALPLLHLAGYSAPREGLVLGHSPVGLQRLLGEVYTAMCPTAAVRPVLPLPPPQDPRRAASEAARGPAAVTGHGRAEGRGSGSDNSNSNSDSSDNSNTYSQDMSSSSSVRRRAEEAVPKRSEKVRLGVVSGSFDGIAGRLIVGMFDGLDKSIRSNIILMAMCFPTPRDHTTDRVNAVFDKHINLSPNNKSQAVERILSSRPDFLLFSDAGLDSRVFAMAHERLAPFQGALWGWGGSLGVPSIDYYIAPEVLWTKSRCRLSDGNAEYSIPQELYSEQVILLEGIPPLPSVTTTTATATASSARSKEISGPVVRSPLIIEDGNVLELRYLLPPLNSSHVYLFSGSVRYMHPEFDAALGFLLKTDPKAIVVVATTGVGRDRLPATHSASRYDLMHPSMPAAAVARVKARLRLSMGVSVARCVAVLCCVVFCCTVLCYTILITTVKIPIYSRVRFMPPLDERMYQALKSAAIAILDPFPVGMHIPILEAIEEGIPVVRGLSMMCYAML